MTRKRRQAEERTQGLEAARGALDEAARIAADAASRARVMSRHRSGVVDPNIAAVDASPSGAAYQLARRGGEEIVRWRRQTIARLEALVSTAETEATRLTQAQSDEDRCRSDAAEAAGRVAAADEAIGTAAAALVATVHAYLAGLLLVRLADPTTVVTAVQEWAASLDGDNPAIRAVHDAADAVTRQLAARQASVEHERGTARELIDRLEAELASLEAGGHPAPPAPYTRGTEVRTGRPGAPLWRVVDFVPGVAEADRAGIEAALEASGLLDAWVLPQGALLHPDDDDVLLVAREPVADGPGAAGLGSVLVPAVDPGVAASLSAETVAGILAAIGLGPASSVDTWVAADGTFRIGALEGHWRKTAAAHIGEGAREAARQARIARLHEEREFHALVVADCESRLAELAHELAAVAEERAALPADSAVREAHATARHERESLRRTERALVAATERVAAQRLAAHTVQAAAAEFAADVDLVATRGDIADVRSAT